MANRFPIVFNSSAVGTSGLEEIKQGDNLNLQGVSIIDAVNITASGTLQVNSVTASNISLNGDALSTVATTGSYSDLLNKPTLFSGDYNDLTNKPVDLVTSWNDITNKPEIPTNISDLVNDSGFVTNGTATIQHTQVLGLATVASTGNYSDLLNKPDYITREEVADGTLSVEVNNTGNLVGSVFGDDSTLLVDHINSSIPAEVLTGTANINVVGNITGTVDGTLTGDVKGSVFNDDSSVMVDSVSNRLFAESVDADMVITSQINSQNNPLEVTGTNVVFLSTGDISANSVTNLSITATDTAQILSANNTTISASVGELTLLGNSIRFMATVPTSARGSQNDLEGNLAFDGSYIYYCTADYTDGLSPIWVRQAWGDTSDWS